MKELEEREKGFERKYRRDQEVAFKAKIRCAKLLAQWAAGQLGLQDAAADALIRAAIDTAFADSGNSAVVNRLADAFAAKKMRVTHDMVRVEHDRLLVVARQQLIGEIETDKQAISPE